MTKINIDKSRLLLISLVLLLATSSCKNSEKSSLQADFNTFASAPLRVGNSCDLELISCKIGPDVIKKKKWLQEYLKENKLQNPKAPNSFIRHVKISREDIENAVHSCKDESCEALFEKEISIKEVGSLDLPLKFNTKVKVKYYRGKNSQGETAMRRLTLNSGGIDFDIGEFTEISAKASMILDAKGVGTDPSKLEYAFSFGGEISAKLPYLSFAVQIDNRGIGLSSAMSPNFKGEFMSLKLPVISGSHFIPYSEISRNFRRAIIKQSYDPATEAYWDQFADRLAVLDGY